MLIIWTGGMVSLCVVNVTCTNLDSLAFILQLFNHFCIASRLVCSFCKAMPGLVSVGNTAVLSANIAVVDSVEFAGLQCIAGITVAPRLWPGEHQL
jgi:hypothetical protein